VGVLYSTIGARVVATDAYVVEMVALLQVFHRFEEGWTIVSNNLMERSPPAEDILIDPISEHSGGLCSQHAELGVVGEGTTGLYNILIYSRWQHMHGIDVGFGEDRGGSGDDRWDEDLASVAQLAYMTSFSIPVNVADYTGPPKVLTDMSFGGIECFMAKGVVHGADDGKSLTWWDD
jgi:hypothetical protein